MATMLLVIHGLCNGKTKPAYVLIPQPWVSNREEHARYAGTAARGRCNLHFTSLSLCSLVLSISGTLEFRSPIHGTPRAPASAPAGGGPEACTCVVWDSRADAEDPCGRAVGMSIENAGGSGEASGGSADGGAAPPLVQSEGMSAGAVGSSSVGGALLPREQVEYMSMDVGGASEGGAAGSSSSGVPPPGAQVEYMA